MISTTSCLGTIVLIAIVYWQNLNKNQKCYKIIPC